MVIRFCVCVLLILNLISVAAQQSSKSSAKRCIKVTSVIAQYGDGSTEDSCMGCDPARPDCATDCQSLINSMYTSCDGVCLPDGYYYDPLSTITGCWEEVKPSLKIGVERCGCDAASSVTTIAITTVLAAAIMCGMLLV